MLRTTCRSYVFSGMNRDDPWSRYSSESSEVSQLERTPTHFARHSLAWGCFRFRWLCLALTASTGPFLGQILPSQGYSHSMTARVVLSLSKRFDGSTPGSQFRMDTLVILWVFTDPKLETYHFQVGGCILDSKSQSAFCNAVLRGLIQKKKHPTHSPKLMF